MAPAPNTRIFMALFPGDANWRRADTHSQYDGTLASNVAVVRGRAFAPSAPVRHRRAATLSRKTPYTNGMNL